MSPPETRVPLSARIASAHGLNWAFDSKYRWAWYIWPQTVAVLAAAWLLAGMPDVVPHGSWSKPAETAGAQMDTLRNAAKTDASARDRLKRLAEAGDPFAQFSYATLFDPVFKFTDSPDINTAVEWYLKAANQGHAVAQSNYGLRHYYGQGALKVDYDKAFPWLLKGAEQGNTDAQRVVGEAFKLGRGTKEDIATALKWFRSGADKGDSFSQEEIGDAYAEGKAGYEKNSTEAIAWWRKAAHQKSAYAQRRLGASYLDGQNGVQRDPATAYEYLKPSAESGDKVAQYYLGYMYQQGAFVKEDLPTAIAWFRKSADQGYADAQNAMGEAYLTGIGATKDKDAAKSWFEKAAANGNKKAADSLKALGSAVPQRNEVATDRAATTSDLDSAKTCLDEENPGIADGVCRVFVGNTAGLSKPTLAAVFSKLARVSLQLKDYKSALSYSKQALEIAPTAVQHYITGQAYAGLKDPSHAIEEYGNALSMAPKYLLAFQRRGEAYLEMGDFSRAKSDFEMALSINPKFTPSIEALQRVKNRG